MLRGLFRRIIPHGNGLSYDISLSLMGKLLLSRQPLLQPRLRLYSRSRTVGPRGIREHAPPNKITLANPRTMTRNKEGALINTELSHDQEDSIHDVARKDFAGSLVSTPALVICRQIEMMNVFIGFEQSNKYVMYDSDGNTVGYIAEDSQTMTSTLVRNLAGTHRPFSCVVLDTAGNKFLVIKRSFAFINSYIKVFLCNEGSETLIGEVRQRFHVIRRKYELFINHKHTMEQFGEIDEPPLSWDFSIKDSQGSTISSINRNMRGLVRELFTDTGHYVLRMSQTSASGINDASTQDEGHEARSAIAQTDLRSQLSSTEAVLKTEERMVLLATAVAIDFDYFSRHSNSSGGMGMGMPMFFPMGSHDSTQASGGPQEGSQAGDDGTLGPSAQVPEQSDATLNDTINDQGIDQQSGNWWDADNSAEASERNWWDEQPSSGDTEQGGGWFDDFDE